MVAANAAVGYNTQKTRMQEEKIPQMKLFKKKDLFLLGALLLVAAGIALFYLLRPAGARAIVTINGAESQEIDLSKDGIYQIEGAALPVTLEVCEGKIRFINSQCPDHLCEGFGYLDSEGEYAICMPAGVAVTIAE